MSVALVGSSDVSLAGPDVEFPLAVAVFVTLPAVTSAKVIVYVPPIVVLSFDPTAILAIGPPDITTVSYTHLTLPTIYSV